jgi:chemotaxis family two-component system sensor kinase Cph1
MLLEFASWFDGDGLLPHAWCLQLRPDLLWLHVVSDAIIFLAYFMIPLTLVYFIRKQRFQLSFSWAIVLFALFIVLCGAGHGVEIITMWKPVYYGQGFLKAATALASIATAFAIIPLVPRLLRLRSPEELERVNKQLQVEIAARGRVEAELRDSVSELDRAVHDLEQFAYVASHDLRAPLRTIVGFSQLLKRRNRERLDADANELIDCIVDGTRSMQGVIDGLLELSRVERHVGQLEKVPMVRIVEAVRRALAADLLRSGAVIVHGELPEVQANPALMTQLLQNLVGNALKFQAAGNVPRVEIAGFVDADSVHLIVTDNGIGIAEADCERIFGMFKRLRPAEEFEGAGIGLAICRKIAGFHGGRIWAQPRSRGAEFHVQLPLQPAATPRRSRELPLLAVT